jgi:hypothetical protein
MYEKKYLQRLAKVYIDRYEKEGAESAKDWWQNFLNKDIRKEMKSYIAEEIARRSREGKKK